MAKLSISDTQKIAKLAKLGLTPGEESKITIELNSIVKFVDAIQKTDTKNIEQTSQVTGLVDVWREDEIKPCKISREEFLKNAPLTEGGYIKVKRVL
ncbi:MAG: Asp-tRNA(Asn)/Glu-tRNA(Gln) amidotransferase subunit GatC [bacterium]|nr:Asp-tRNA(Asn)/Glu-tRNA(Gln) amidotransferase subunit GatC [bacterium]